MATERALLPPGGCIVLHPTPTRLALLAAVQAGNVVEGITEDHMTGAGVPHTFLLDDPDKPRKVCARAKEAEAAGWVELDEAGVTWRLTEYGRKVLADGV
jgi:hypothetical protein